MVKQRETNTKRWGTLEELLLASAVNRHGTTSWDSVAMEIQNRCSQSPSSLSPQDCRNKFYDLKRRFLSQNDLDSDSTSLMPMLDELRKIRVEELRRDVQRRDVLIVSLEMKVKRLEEERDGSLNEADRGPDLDVAVKTNLRPLNPTASGDDSDDRENRSLNESNSTSKKDDVRQNGVVEESPIAESVKISKSKETGPPRTGDEPGREWSMSYNGAAAEPEPEREKESGASASGGGNKRREKERNWGNSKSAMGDSNEAWESVSESKQEGKEGAVSKQQSSDVQSSGSLSQRKRCRNRGGTGTGTGTSSGEEPEVSPANPKPKPKPKPIAVKSEPLLKFLEIIRSHQLGSAFERRLRSQESDRYKKLIRQHIDLRTIHSRVVKGAYADTIHRFFRDLLLLFNNAIIFFHRSSPENGAAVKLRGLVLKEMKDKIRKPETPTPIVAKSKPKQEADVSSSKPSKPSTTMVGCRKRDSVAQIADAGGKKSEKNSRDGEGKAKGSDISEIKIYEKGTWKKGLNLKERGRPAAGSRSSRTTTSKNNGEVKHEYGGNELSSHDGMEVRMEKKERVTKKKQGAVSFLKRMKQNSPSEVTDEDGDGSEDESLKEEEEEGEEEEAEEEEEAVEEKKRKIKKQNEGKRERVRRSGGGGGGGGGGRGIGGGGRGKRGVGRPPKKAETVTVKRQQREEVGGGKARKRSRR